ncbi:MAG: NAD(P)-binding domain-containing protein, partial [Chloroflexi bacterium]|nr:NAD(P)-binding domain-containing protein [Chloroflexota bacterium]
MDIGMIGLGRMGGNMAERLLLGGHRVVVNNRSRDPIDEYAAKGAVPAYTVEDLVKQLQPPRAVWIMVPAGEATENMIERVVGLLGRGDTIVEGGNSMYKDSIRRAAAVKARGVQYVDAGTSGGIWGLKIGYCLMVGGDRDAVEPLEPIFRTLAPEDGYAHVGPSGAGHFVKMIHNGIEYG